MLLDQSLVSVLGFHVRFGLFGFTLLLVLLCRDRSRFWSHFTVLSLHDFRSRLFWFRNLIEIYIEPAIIVLGGRCNCHVLTFSTILFGSLLNWRRRNAISLLTNAF